MKYNLKRVLIRLHGILAASTGLLAMFFFFPSAEGCSELWTCLLYVLCGFILFILGLGIVLLKEMARKFMILFSCLFTVFYVYQTIWLLNNDQTGQGLVGMLLLSPIFANGCIGLALLLPSAIGREFKHTQSLTGRS